MKIFIILFVTVYFVESQAQISLDYLPAPCPSQQLTRLCPPPPPRNPCPFCPQRNCPICAPERICPRCPPRIQCPICPSIPPPRPCDCGRTIVDSDGYDYSPPRIPFFYKK